MPNQVIASNLPFYDIFVPQKVPLSKISDDVIACDFVVCLSPNPKSWLRPWVKPFFNAKALLNLYYAIFYQYLLHDLIYFVLNFKNLSKEKLSSSNTILGKIGYP